MLTRTALECCRRMNFRPHIVHSHDWHTAFAPLWLRSNYRNDPVFARTRSVLTIHNIGYQGELAASDAADLDLGPDAYLLHQDDLAAGRINALKHGILNADAITTVSPTYAVEITTPQYGMGMEQALAARGNAVHGILNGVDYDEWDPRRDRYLPIHFGPEDLAPKAELKRNFLLRQNLRPTQGRVPLFGIVSRLASQKGFDLLTDTLPKLLKENDVRVAVVGTGDASTRSFCRLAENTAAVRGSSAATTSPWRTGSKAPATCSSCLRYMSPAASTRCTACVTAPYPWSVARAASQIPLSTSTRPPVRGRASCSMTSMPARCSGRWTRPCSGTRNRRSGSGWCVMA